MGNENLTSPEELQMTAERIQKQARTTDAMIVSTLFGCTSIIVERLDRLTELVEKVVESTSNYGHPEERP